jgi:Concanavalin A-like lectin/glucanases superfamily
MKAARCPNKGRDEVRAVLERNHLGVITIVAAALLTVCLLLWSKPTWGASASPAFEFRFEEGSGTTATNTGTVRLPSNGSIGEGISYSTDTPLGTGYALDFEGIGDDSFPKTKGRITVPVSFNYSDQVTIEAWIKPELTNGQRIIWDNFGRPGVLLAVWDGRVQFGGSTTVHPDISNFSGNVETGRWQHIAGVYDGTALRVCVDGQSTGMVVPASGEIIEDPAGNGFIGNGGGENLPWDGKLDDFRIWPVALQCAQVAGGYFADTTTPTITLDSPTEGATYTLGQNVIANYSCADDKSSGSDLSCTGSVPTGSSIDTGSVGTKTFTVTATDKAGNTQTKTVSYKVVSPCTIGEIAPPVNDVSSADDPGMSAYKFGSRGVIPAKFRAACNGDPIDTHAEADAHPLKLKLTKLGATPDQDAVVENTVTGSANTGDLFRFDDAADHYIYNVGVKNLASGTYKLTINEANGGATHDEWFSVK